MKKCKIYYECRFNAETIRDATNTLEHFANEKQKGEIDFEYFVVDHGDSEWNYDTKEEFLADFSKYHGHASYTIRYNHRIGIDISFSKREVKVCVEDSKRISIETIFNIFEESFDKSRLKPLPADPPVVFIGHGGNPCWTQLKDHLQDMHGIKVIAYETGARAGHLMRDILEEMITDSSFALLVFTGEDVQENELVRARQNVVHEAGLFQGRLGFPRAIILLEEGVEGFSNIDGVQHIKFSRNNIKEVFGDVVATIRREFGNFN